MQREVNDATEDPWEQRPCAACPTIEGMVTTVTDGKLVNDSQISGRASADLRVVEADRTALLDRRALLRERFAGEVRRLIDNADLSQLPQGAQPPSTVKKRGTLRSGCGFWARTPILWAAASIKESGSLFMGSR